MQFTWACDAVVRVCGETFVRTPEIYACATVHFAAINQAIAEGTNPLRVLWGFEFEPEAWSVKEAESCVAICSTTENTVFLHPAVGSRWVAESGEVCSNLSIDFLRLILVHEATHMLDAQRWPHFSTDVLGVDEEQAFDMRLMIEGHAEYVVAEVALALGASNAYTMYVAASRGVPCDLSMDAHLVAAYGNIEYGRCLRLLRRAKDLGGTALLDRVLAHPPPYIGSQAWEEALLQTRLAELQR